MSIFFRVATTAHLSIDIQFNSSGEKKESKEIVHNQDWNHTHF